MHNTNISCEILDKATSCSDQKVSLKYFLNIFSNAIDLPVTVTDPEGTCFLSSDTEDTEFCRLIKSSPTGLKRCQNTYCNAGKEALKWNEPYIFQCHAGILAWACPIFSDGNHLGNIVSGQILMREPEKYCLLQIKENTNDLGLNEEELATAVKQLPIISSNKIQGIVDLLYFSSKNFTKFFPDLTNYRNELRSAGLWLWAKGYKDKSSTLQGKEQQIADLQEEILLKIKQSKISEAKNLLSELIVHFFSQSKGQLEVIKGFTIEFVSLLVRFATECGINFNEIMEQGPFQIKDLQDADTVDKVFLWFMKTGTYFIDLLSKNVESKSETVVDCAIEYINANYNSLNLSLTEIANAIYISPTYLSRIFKKETGDNLTTYINKTRIEQSKNFLRHHDDSIEEIAKKVGYRNRIYFWKMFKQFIGTSPYEYRKNYAMQKLS